MAYKYYVVNHRGYAIEVTDNPMMQEFFVPKNDIVEHLKAQIAYIKDGHKGHKIQPIIIGIPQEKFVQVVESVCGGKKGFLHNYLINKNKISIKVSPVGQELIRVINEGALQIDEPETIKND